MLRDQFARELDYLWQGLRRFGERHPRLQALYAQNADPRVTRLVQSAAFAFASLHGRLHDDGQSLVRPLVAAAMPESLRPRPASTILQLTGGSSRPGAVFVGRTRGADVPFELMWPVDVSAVDLSDVSLERVDANLQVLHMTLTGRPGVVLGTILPDALRVFVKVTTYPTRETKGLAFTYRGSQSPPTRAPTGSSKACSSGETPSRRSFRHRMLCAERCGSSGSYSRGPSPSATSASASPP